MKVLMLSKACVVGAYQRKLEAIAACGVDLTVIVPPSWKDPSSTRRLEKQYLRGYRMIVAPMRFNGHFHLHYYPSLLRHLRDVRPDVFHIDEEPWDLVTYHAVRCAQQVGAQPLFFSWQNLLRRYPPPFSYFEQYAFRHCQHAITGNTDAGNVLRAKGYGGHISVIPQFGVDPEIFTPGPHPHLSPNLGEGRAAHGERALNHPFTIAYAGRLVPEKGVDLLLRAVTNLSGDWRVRLFGSGPAQRRLQQLAMQLNIGERVHFEQQVASWQMPDYYAQTDVVVLPSRRARHWVEQFGRVLIEAMACGVPVIGAETGEIPNTIGDAGLIFPENDVNALRQCLERLRCDGELRKALSERGRARVLSKFTQASVAQRTVEVYQKLMEH